MAMVCPLGHGFFDRRLDCPRCGSSLVYQAPAPRSEFPGYDNYWQQTPWGRLLIGLLLGQGLYYALRQLCTAGLFVFRSDDVWPTFAGIIILQGLQGVSVLAAGMLVGAGQRRGMVYGGVVGVWNGVLFVLFKSLLAKNGVNQSLATIIGEPLVQSAFGAVGGLIGMGIWKPAASLDPYGMDRFTPPDLPGYSSFSVPIAWTRIIAGVALAVGGVVYSDVISGFVIDASEGRLKIESHLQANLVIWEISALAMFAGGVLAGATTNSGLKQGLVAGIGMGTLLCGIRLASLDAPFQTLILTATSSLGLGSAGGWFGSQLLPPVHSSRRKRRPGPADLI